MQRVAVPSPPARIVAEGLHAFGVRSGSLIALMGLVDPDRPAAGDDPPLGGPQADVSAAAQLLGARIVLVPAHAHGPRLRVRLRGVRAVVTLDGHQRQIAAVAGDLPDLHHVWIWDGGGAEELAAAARGLMPVFAD